MAVEQCLKCRHCLKAVVGKCLHKGARCRMSQLSPVTVATDARHIIVYSSLLFKFVFLVLLLVFTEGNQVLDVSALHSHSSNRCWEYFIVFCFSFIVI